jgi:ankyrin repeat protein
VRVNHENMNEWRALRDCTCLNAHNIFMIANTPNADGQHPLITAVDCESDACPCQLVKQHCADGALVDAVSKEGLTALTIATIRGWYHVVKVLLDNGADSNKGGTLTPPNVLDIMSTKFDNSRPIKDWWSPMRVATLAGHADIARLLIKRGAQPSFIRTEIDDHETLDILGQYCCAQCGTTSFNLAAQHKIYLLGDMAEPEPQLRLHRCDGCPAPDLCAATARYCTKACQTAHWVDEHRAECVGAKAVAWRSLHCAP